MKTMITVMLTISLFFTLGCGEQNNSQQQVQTQETVSAPKVDLHSAVVTNNIDAIRQHIKAGSDLDVLEPSRASTPLITAAALGKTEAAKLLIDAGAALNYQNADGSTALHTAAVFGQTEVARKLIDAGIDLSAQNMHGSTALHTAAFFCRVDIVKALLAKNADKTVKNNAGQTPAETVAASFDQVKGFYDAVGASLKPLGLILDYDYIKATRPRIAEMLK